MRKILVAVLATLGLVFASAPPASAANITRDCVWKAGDAQSAKFCWVIRWDRVDGEVRVLKSTLRMTSSLSDGALGYQGMHDIDTRRTAVVSGNVLHYHDNASTGSREWVDSHNTRHEYLRVSVDFDIGWNNWPDDEEVYLAVWLN